MEEITFSTDTGRISREDIDATSKLAEEYFEMEDDPDQIPATSGNRDWVFNNIPECLNVIRNDGEIIGYTFIIPSSRELMERFIDEEITDNEMFEEIKKLKFYDGIDAVYLCASFIKPEFRGRGLAVKGRAKSIKKIIEKRGRDDLVLYFWSYSEEGKKSCLRVAEELGLEIKERKE